MHDGALQREASRDDVQEASDCQARIERNHSVRSIHLSGYRPDESES